MFQYLINPAIQCKINSFRLALDVPGYSKSAIVGSLAALMLLVPPALRPQSIRPPALPRNQPLSSNLVLNHLFVVLDPDTYACIAKSDFMRTEFAPLEVRSTVRADQSYRGMYLYGANTYIEFFQSAEMAAQGYKPRETGIAFGVEDPGAIGDVKSRMAAKIPAHNLTVTRLYADEQLPWFYMLEPKGFAFRTWIMEYHPSFLAQWNPSSKPAENEGITRSLVLDRYKSVVDDGPKDAWFRDVTSITMAADPDLMAKLSQLYQLWGMRVHTKAGSVSFESADLTIHLLPESPTVKGIQQIEFRLNRPVKDQAPVHFGEKSILSFRGKVGTWTF